MFIYDPCYDTPMFETLNGLSIGLYLLGSATIILGMRKFWR